LPVQRSSQHVSHFVHIEGVLAVLTRQLADLCWGEIREKEEWVRRHKRQHFVEARIRLRLVWTQKLGYHSALSQSFSFLILQQRRCHSVYSLASPLTSAPPRSTSLLTLKSGLCLSCSEGSAALTMLPSGKSSAWTRPRLATSSTSRSRRRGMAMMMVAAWKEGGEVLVQVAWNAQKHSVTIFFCCIAN